MSQLMSNVSPKIVSVPSFLSPNIVTSNVTVNE